MSTPRKDTQLLGAIAHRLQELRKKHGLSQVRVSMDTGVNISRTESGKRTLSIHSVAILCSYYGISLECFFKGIDLAGKSWE